MVSADEKNLSSTLNINNFLYNGKNWFKFSTFFASSFQVYIWLPKKKKKKEKWVL